MDKFLIKGKENIKKVKFWKKDSQKSSLVVSSKSEEKIKSTKNILLIGRSGNGKSTLANVLTNTNDFKESIGSTSETRIIQSQEFNILDTKYLVIDTPGIGDTKLPQEQVLDIIAEAVYLAREGVSQVLFVSKTRFDQYEMATYNILREVIFDAEITKHTTLIRSHFSEFAEKEDCQEDLEKMLEQDDLKEIIESCQKRVIHVDNPSVATNLADEKRTINQKQRIASHKKILAHLTNRCIVDYQPSQLKNLNQALEKVMKEKKDLETKLQDLANKSQSSTPLNSPPLEDKGKAREILPIDLTETEQISYQEPIKGVSERRYLTSHTRKLESDKERLEKEIAEKQKMIRQKVLKHILNNAENITEQLGGDMFLESITDDGQDWTILHSKFTLESKIKWLQKDFNYQQVQDWLQALGDDFRPEKDYSFCAWLRDHKQLVPSSLPKYDLKDLEKEYQDWLESYNQGLQEITNPDLEENLSPAQQWLDENYPLEKRHEIIELNIDHNSLGFWQKGEKDLEGSINLKGFANLKKLSFYYNKELTDLDLSDCGELQIIEGSDCNLTSINFLLQLPNPEKLIHLDICGNNITLSDLSCFSKFTNLKELKIGSMTGGSDPASRERFAKGIYNRFYGSLKPLQNLKELKKLSIANTDIDSGLEYLSESLEFIETRVGFEELERKDSKVNEIHEILELCEGSIVRWREENPDLVRKAQEGANESSDTDSEVFLEEDGYLDAQKWLEQRYPLKERDSIKKLNLKEEKLGNIYEQSLGAKLRIDSFENLENLNLSYNKIKSLIINNCPNIIKINCSYNNLKRLKIINCPKLVKLDFWGCGLTDFDFSTLNPESLIHLSIGDNNLSPRNVSCLAPFVNLEWARIGTMTRSREKSIHAPRNRFCGSLRAFKDMKNLRTLNIADTDIDRGLEFLPKSLEERNFEFHSNNDSFKVSKIKEEKKIKTVAFLPQENQLVNWLKSKSVLSLKESQQIKDYLRSKQAFIKARSETVVELQQCCNSLEIALVKGKYAKNEERTKTLAITGKAAGSWTFNIIEATGEAANLANAHFKRLFTIKKGKQFQLTLKDEPEIKEMEQVHQELLTLLKEEISLFANDYKLYDVITNIWAGKAHIDTSDMKDALSLLVQNHRLLTKELTQQENQLKEFGISFELEKLTLTSAEEQAKQLQTKINQLQVNLENLIATTKIKLVSKSKFSTSDHKTREEKLTTLFQTFPNSSPQFKQALESIKQDLSKRLTEQEINNLIQTQSKLIDLQAELTNLQNQQQQAQIQIAP